MSQHLRSDAEKAAHQLLQLALAGRFPGREPTAEEFNELLGQLVRKREAAEDDGLFTAEIRAALVKMRRPSDADS